MKKRTVLPLVLLLLVGCAKTTVHPGTYNQVDSDAYTVLLDAQQTLVGAQANITSGKWPAAWNEYINSAGNAYNISMASYTAYHNIAVGLKQGDLTAAQQQMQQDLRLLTSSIKVLLKATGGAK